MQPDTEGAEHEQRAAEEICRSIYEETATFYERKAPGVAGQDLGYRILMGRLLFARRISSSAINQAGGPKFSSERARRIIETFRPKHLVVIGLKFFAGWTPQQLRAWCANGRRLVVQGEIWGVTAFVTIHPSGARLSGDDLKAIEA